MNPGKYNFLTLDFVVIDASAFFTIDDELMSELIKHKSIYIPKTFNCDCAQFLQIATSAEKESYKRNTQAIKEVTIKTLPYGSISAGIDTYGAAKYFAEQDVDVVVLSSDLTLIERLTLDEIEAYVYNPRTSELHRYYKYAEEKSKFEIHADEFIIDSGCAINTGFSLYSGSDKKYTLGSRYASGTEAVIYYIKDNPSLLAKIYQPKTLTAEKAKNIEKLVAIGKSINAAWCPFPIDLLYSHNDKKYPVGYIMSFKKDLKLLSDITLYGGDVSNILPDYRETRISDTVDLCIGLVQKIAYLNCYGILVTDFNDRNFAISGSNISSNTLFLDADSFCHGNYLSNCRAQYLDDEYTRAYKFGSLSKSEAIMFSFESLCMFVFKLLTLGESPVFNWKFRFRNDRINHDSDYRWALVPDNLQQVFVKVFEKKEICSTSELLFALVEAQKSLQRNRALNSTYHSRCSKYIYSINSDNLGDNFTGLLFSVDDSSKRRVVSRTKDAPSISEEKWNTEEVLTFKRNSDGTYCIMSSANNGFLSVSGDYNNPVLSFSATNVSFSEKWRIEKLLVSNDNFGHPVYKCYIESELFPQLVLSVENNTSLKMHSTYEETGYNNNLCICHVTPTQHCNDKRVAVYKPTVAGTSSGSSNSSSPAQSQDFMDKLYDLWDKFTDFLSDTFKPDGTRWDSIGKPAIIVAVVLLVLLMMFGSCVSCGCASTGVDASSGMNIEYSSFAQESEASVLEMSSQSLMNLSDHVI